MWSICGCAAVRRHVGNPPLIIDQSNVKTEGHTAGSLHESLGHTRYKWLNENRRPRELGCRGDRPTAGRALRNRASCASVAEIGCREPFVPLGSGPVGTSVGRTVLAVIVGMKRTVWCEYGTYVVTFRAGLPGSCVLPCRPLASASESRARSMIRH